LTEKQNIKLKKKQEMLLICTIERLYKHTTRIGAQVYDDKTHFSFTQAQVRRLKTPKQGSIKRRASRVKFDHISREAHQRRTATNSMADRHKNHSLVRVD
jgi:hypothetical protein